MKALQPTRSEVIAKFAAGLHCSHCSLCPWAGELGYDEEDLSRVASPFGGGMFRGETCGAVSGSLMAIGLAVGGSEREQIGRAKELAVEFQRQFEERFGSTICRELIGFDIRDPEQQKKAAESGIMMDLCPELVCGSVEICNKILAEE